MGGAPGESPARRFLLACNRRATAQGLAIMSDDYWGSWAKGEWDSEEPSCVRCHRVLSLRDEHEWSEYPELNLCDDCARRVLEQVRELWLDLKSSLNNEESCHGKLKLEVAFAEDRDAIMARNLIDAIKVAHWHKGAYRPERAWLKEKANRQSGGHLKAAQDICEVYFNIAAEAIGEDEVRRRRDAMLATAVDQLNHSAPEKIPLANSPAPAPISEP